mmetsp:Transcript_52907/g.170763  ORF Transcript_52907/g.170763 Transcript_52907/m.170763 type:complete len:240 (+) Transcript_52907:879-1598(+)
MCTVAAPRVRTHVFAEQLNDEPLLGGESVLQYRLDDIVAVVALDELVRFQEQLIHQPGSGSVPGGILKQPAVNPATILVACEVEAGLRYLLDHKADLLGRELLDDLLHHEVRVWRLDGFRDDALKAIRNLNGRLPIHNLQGLLHCAATGRLEGQSPNNTLLPENIHSCNDGGARVLTFRGQEFNQVVGQYRIRGGAARVQQRPEAVVLLHGPLPSATPRRRLVTVRQHSAVFGRPTLGF